MSSSRYYVGAYWFARREPRSVCAARAQEMFAELAKCDPRLSNWHLKGWTLKQAQKHRVIPSQLGIAKILERSGLEEDEWFSFDVWNRDLGSDNTTLSLTAGSSSEIVPNRCLVHLQAEDEPPETPWSRAIVGCIVRVLVRTWDPDWAVATSDTEGEVLQVAEFARHAGALTYFSDRLGKLPGLPAQVTTERIDSLGTMLALPEGTVADPEYLSLAKQVNASLDQAGFLRYHVEKH